MELDSRSCPICGLADRSVVYRFANVDTARLTDSAFASRKLPEYMHFQLMKCTQCDLVYASPAIRGDSLAEAYRNASFDAGRESTYAAKTYYSYLRKRTGAKPVAALDIGAGDGAFLAELMRNGYHDVVGYEPSKAPFESASAEVRAKLRNEMFDGKQIGDGSFGLVTCFQTIEHVYEPSALVREMHRILIPKGAAFIIGHNVEALSARLLGEKSPIFDIEHYQLFNFRSAKVLMKNAGFSSVAVFPIMNAYPLSYWVKLFPIPEPFKRNVLNLLQSKLRRLGDSAVSLPAGNLGIIATK